METHSTPVNTTAWFTGYQKKWIATSITALAVAVLASFGAYYGSQILLNAGLTYGAYGTLAVSIGVIVFALLHIKKTSQATPLPKLKKREQKGLDPKIKFAPSESDKLIMCKYEVSWNKIDPQDVMTKLKAKAPLPKQMILDRYTSLIPQKGSFSFAQYELKQDSWNGLCNQNFAPLQQTSVETTRKFYDYTSEATYCVFGNKHYGGGHLENGYTQEEMAVLQSFNSTALTYFCTRPEVVKGSKLNPERPRPLLLYNLSQDLEFNPQKKWVNYHDFAPEKSTEEELRAEIEQNIKTTYPLETYNLVSIVAIDWRETVSPDPYYTITQLKYLLEAAYAACHSVTLEKNKEQTLHTGLWGCGIFKNSLYVMIAIQLLAARMAGISIKFYGIARGSDLAKKIPNLVDLVNSGIPSKVLEKILSYQNDNKVGRMWKPQTAKK